MRSFTLVHLSDLHFLERGNPKTDALESAVAAAIRKTSSKSTTILLITGDLVEAPTSVALDAAKEFVERLGALFTHVLVIPGNHDAKRVLGNLSYTLTAYRRTFGDKTNLLIRDIGLHLIGVDSTPSEFARGKVVSEQYDTMVKHVYSAEKLHGDEKTSLIRIVAIHHHPLPLIEGEDDKVFGIETEQYMYLKGPAKFLQACISCGVKLILHGHRHVPGLARYSMPTTDLVPIYSDDIWEDIYVLSCPSSTGKGCDAGFNVIDCVRSGEAMHVRRYQRIKNTGRFTLRDNNLPDSQITLNLGTSVRRDPAVDVAAGLSRLSEQPLESELLPLAERLFKRRAFYEATERDWRFLLYALTQTRMIWEQEVDYRLQLHRKSASAKVREILNMLESYVANNVICVSGLDFETIKSKFINDKMQFVVALPITDYSHHETALFEEDRKIMHQELRKALKACGISIPNLGVNFESLRERSDIYTDPYDVWPAIIPSDHPDN